MKLNSLILAGACLSMLTGPAFAGESADAECKDGECKVSCVEPSTVCIESEKIVETLQTMAKALTKGDLKTYENYIDEGCTTFDEKTKKLIVGKAAVLEDIKQKLERYGPTSPTPLISYTIDHPHARVTGDTAVVTFVAIREFGGAHPMKEKSNITDVFVKHDGTWKKLHYRGHWKKVT